MVPATSHKGKYSARVMTERAVNITRDHPLQKNLYVYLAFHNVHNPLMAPLETVEQLSRTSSDVRRVYEAMLTEVDTGVGRIVEGLKARDMLSRTVFLVHSDNGGAKYASSNWPLRGNKFTNWEGGLRAVAVVSNPGGSLIPPSMRGVVLTNGFGHLSDWYYTIAHGIAGASSEGSLESGPIEPDSVNLWPWLTGQVSASPRTVVLHAPLSEATTKMCNIPYGPGHGCGAAVRKGDWKLIIGDPGDDQLFEMPALLESEREFMAGPPGACSADKIKGHARCRGLWDGKTITHQSSKCDTHHPCLFNVKADPSEHENLAEEYPDVVEELTAVLTEAGTTEPPEDFNDIVDDRDHRRLHGLMCNGMLASGYDFPADWML